MKVAKCDKCGELVKDIAGALHIPDLTIQYFANHKDGDGNTKPEWMSTRELDFCSIMCFSQYFEDLAEERREYEK